MQRHQRAQTLWRDWSVRPWCPEHTFWTPTTPLPLLWVRHCDLDILCDLKGTFHTFNTVTSTACGTHKEHPMGSTLWPQYSVWPGNSIPLVQICDLDTLWTCNEHPLGLTLWPGRFVWPRRNIPWVQHRDLNSLCDLKQTNKQTKQNKTKQQQQQKTAHGFDTFLCDLKRTSRRLNTVTSTLCNLEGTSHEFNTLTSTFCVIWNEHPIGSTPWLPHWGTAQGSTS